MRFWYKYNGDDEYFFMEGDRVLEKRKPLGILASAGEKFLVLLRVGRYDIVYEDFKNEVKQLHSAGFHAMAAELNLIKIKGDKSDIINRMLSTSALPVALLEELKG